MLAGLFLEYRRGNNQGTGFNTIVDQRSFLDNRPDTKLKHEQVNKVLGKPIYSIKEYLELVGFSDGMTLDTLANGLFNFVIEGVIGNEASDP